jgi:HK97 gp10 family phage protein
MSESALEGVNKLMRQLGELGKLEEGKAIRRAVREGIEPALARAKATVPIGSVMHRTYKGRLVAPGFASRNLRLVTSLSRDKQMAAAILGVRNEAYYALLYVEKGTVYMPARPWLKPAFDSTIAWQEAGIRASLLRTLLSTVLKFK